LFFTLDHEHEHSVVVILLKISATHSVFDVERKKNWYYVWIGVVVVDRSNAGVECVAHRDLFLSDSTSHDCLNGSPCLDLRISPQVVTKLQIRYEAVMTDNIPEESPVSIPENLSASIILSTLPRDATTALTQASTPSKTKCMSLPWAF
jgi:hypothetical protein